MENIRGKMNKDEFGDRMKAYEVSSESFLNINEPIMIRLDGRSFSTFTKAFDKPFSREFHFLMSETTKYLVEQTDAKLGYTQSDEISLVFLRATEESQIMFSGRVQKLVSTLSAMASVFFNKKLDELHKHLSNKMPTFDCRVWNVPTLAEAANTILWRENDAIRNSISSLAMENFSANQLAKVPTQKRKQMLAEKGIIWEDIPVMFQRGTYYQRKKSARTNDKGETFMRGTVSHVVFPELRTISNLSAVLFMDQPPVLRQPK